MAVGEDPPALDALDPEPREILLVIERAIERADLPRLCDRIGRLLRDRGAGPVVCDVRALTAPDAVTVDALARLHLTAKRLGGRLGLRHACGRLRDLLALMGLEGIVVLLESSGLEAGRQAEQREQARGVEEETDPRDATT